MDTPSRKWDHLYKSLAFVHIGLLSERLVDDLHVLHISDYSRFLLNLF